MSENQVLVTREPTEVLISKLHVLPPRSFIQIRWTDNTGETQYSEGRIADYTHTSAVRRVETSDRTLVIVQDTIETELTLAELTEASRVNSLGTVDDIEVIEHAIEGLVLTQEGLKLPPYLWGYTGFLVVDTQNESKELRIAKPGLKQYDDQLTAVVRELTTERPSERIRVRLRSGPHRRYDIIRPEPVDDSGFINVDIDTIGDYHTLEPLIHTVAALSDHVKTDVELPKPIRHEATHKLQSLQTPLLEARTLLCDPNPDATWMPNPDKPEIDVSEYPAALEWIQSRLERLEEIVNSEGSIDGEQLRIYSFNPPQRTVEDLSELLLPPLPEIESYDGGSYVPPRESTEGRGTGDGRWLEFQLKNALQRWGYQAGLRETAYGVEIDVVATRRQKQDDPTDWIVAECKDWESRPITEEVLFRLCMLAYTCRAMPILCHTTYLTDRALKIARRWEVRVLQLEDLYRGALPAPDMLDLQRDIETHGGVRTLRESRGMLPLTFFGRPDDHFTYVPGYKPDGILHHYTRVESESQEEIE